MADHKRDPWYMAIRQNMENIVRCVDYKEVRFKMIENELMEPEDQDEYDNLSSNDAVSKIITKVMRSINDCERFVKVLQEMSQPRYRELTEKIIQKYEENGGDTMQHRDLVAITIQQLERSTTEQHRISQSTVDGPLEQSQRMVESLLTQDITTATINRVIGLKKITGKSFAEVLMKTIKIFRKAIKDNKIRFKKSIEQSTLLQLGKSHMELKNAHHIICSTNEGTKIFKNSVATVVAHAKDVLIVIKNVPKINWQNLCETAETIGMLICMFQKITEMVSSIQEVDSEPLCQLFDNMTELKSILTNIKQTLWLHTKIIGFSGSLLYAFGGVTCVILGAVLCITPVAPAGIPFMMAGSVIVATSPAVLDYYKSFYADMTNAIDNAVEEGQKDTTEFLKGDFEMTTSLRAST